MAGPIPRKAAQQTVPLLEDAPVPRKRTEVGTTRLAYGYVQVSAARAGSPRDQTNILGRKVYGSELSNGVNRSHRLFVKSNRFLERCLSSFSQSHTNFDAVDTVASLEFSPETSVRRNHQINATFPMRDFPLRCCTRRASRGEHCDRFEDRGFSARVGANSTKPSR